MAKKKIPAFSQLNPKGEIKFIKNSSTLNSGGTTSFDSNLIITPYSDYIPLLYLFYSNTDPGQYINSWSIKAVLIKQKKTCTTEKINKLVEVMRKLEGRARDYGLAYGRDYLHFLQGYVNYDIPISKNGGYSTGRITDIISNFVNTSGFSDIYNYHTRTVSGAVSNLYLTVMRNGIEVPVVTAVIPRENWYYCKLEYILTGTVDLSKCVILVDRMIQDTSYPNRTVRTMFHNRILPYLNTLDVNIFYVPVDYIEKHCYLQDFSIKAENLSDRKKEKEAYIKELLKTIKQKYNPSGIKPSILEPRINISDSHIDPEVFSIHGADELGTITTTGTGTYALGVDPYGHIIQPSTSFQNTEVIEQPLRPLDLHGGVFDAEALQARLDELMRQQIAHNQRLQQALDLDHIIARDEAERWIPLNEEEL